MKNQKGQSFAELAICTVVFLFIISGLVDFGRMYFTYVAVEDATGEGALYYGINPKCPTEASAPECVAPMNATWRAKNAGQSLIDWNDANIRTYITYDEKTDTYDTNMEISYKYRMVSPVFAPIFPDGLTLPHKAAAPLFHPEDIPSDAEIIVIPCSDC